MTKTARGECQIPYCAREAVIRSLCKRCYSAMDYWRKKTPTQMMRRQEKLRLWDSRMSQFTNVRAVTGRGKKRGQAA